MRQRQFLQLSVGAAIASRLAAPALRQATTVQLPTFGVAVNAQGVLTVKTFEDRGGTLAEERLRASLHSCPPI